MVVTNRDLAVGTKLSVRYKKTLYTAEVVAGEDGVRFRLADGREFKSPSGAGAAVKGGGKTCDGWKFWSLAGGEGQDEAPAEATAAPAAPQTATGAKTAKVSPPKPASTTTVKQIRRVPNRKGVPEGQEKWFCSSCMASFIADAKPEPEACPQGHARLVEDEFAPGPAAAK